MTIMLFQFDISPFCDKVRRVMNFKGLDYETRDPKFSEVDAFKKLNPAGRLPVLDHHGTLIPDSSAICRFLEETYPSPSLIPSDPHQAALVHILEDWADESLYFYELTMRLTWETNAPRVVGELLAKVKAPSFLKALAPKQVMQRYGKVVSAQGIGAKPREVFLRDLGFNLDATQALLSSRDWLVGDQMTLADIAVYVQLACIEGTLEGAPLFETRPTLTKWLRRVEEATPGRKA